MVARHTEFITAHQFIQISDQEAEVSSGSDILHVFQQSPPLDIHVLHLGLALLAVTIDHIESRGEGVNPGDKIFVIILVMILTFMDVYWRLKIKTEDPQYIIFLKYNV